MVVTINAPRKKVVVAITIVVAMMIVLIGTFAWNSLNQSRINVFTEVIKPNVNLHDDFEGGPNKDVYVENSGDVPIYVRVMLQEYLQTENRGSLVAISRYGDGADEDQLQIARETWYPHNGLHPGTGGQGEANQTYINETLGDMWPAGSNFGDYYTWTMGANNRWIYYKPASLVERGTDENGNPLPMLDDDGNAIYDGNGDPVYQTPSVVSDPLTGEKGDASAYYLSEVNKLIAQGRSEAQAMEQLGLKKTLETDKVITMAQWRSAGFASGNFWVVDTDGWCYWAQALEPGEATGVLLDEVNRTSTLFDSNAEYAINVWLQAVDEAEFIDTFAGSGGGITDNARLLLNFANGGLLSDSNNLLYIKNRDGTYIKAYSESEADLEAGKELGKPNVDATPFILLGFDTINNGMAVTDARKFDIGMYFTITDLGWDGDYYENWSASGGSQYNYNITTLTEITSLTVTDGILVDGTGKTVYKFTGIEYGSDGVMYLKAVPVTSTAGAVDETAQVYIGSAKQEGSSGNYTYTQLNPGYGPFVFIYPATKGGAIGTARDMRGDPSVDLGTRFFYHVGNGVYVETATKDDTTSKDSPVKYYFAGTLISKTKVTGATGDTVDEKVGNLFPLVLTEGDSINIEFTSTNTQLVTGAGYEIIADDGGDYTFGLVTGANAQKYIYLGSEEDGYIGIGSLYTTGKSKYLGEKDSDTRVWAGPNGIGTAGDKTLEPVLFGTGTAADPYRIKDEQGLSYIAEQVAAGNTYSGVHFKLTADIDMSVYTGKGNGVGQGAYDNFQRIGYRDRPFKGVFDGNNATISNLVMTAGSAECFGFFGWNEGTVKNLTLDTVTLTGTYRHYAAVVGVNYTTGVVENCHVTGTSTIASGNSGHAGAIVGWNNGTVRSCTTGENVTVNATGNYVGGIVGWVNSSSNVVEDCTNNGKVVQTAGSYIGGVVGYNNGGTVKNCVNNGAFAINGTAGNYFGGVVGESYGPVLNCVNNGTVTSASRAYVGGVVGVNYANIENSYNTAKITGVSYTGGVVSLMNRNTAKIVGSYNTGEIVSTSSYTGGVAGYTVASSVIEKSYNTGKVTGTNNVGGVVGRSYGITKQSYSNAAIHGSNLYVGGVVGYQPGGSIENCYAWGNVSSNNAQVGGVVGRLDTGTVSKSYHAKGEVSTTLTGTSYVYLGGVVGYHYSGTVTQCVGYATKLTGASYYINRIVGYAYSGSRTLCYYGTGTISIAHSGWVGNGTMAATQAAWATTSTTAFNFGTIWTWNTAETLPVLTGVTV